MEVSSGALNTALKLGAIFTYIFIIGLLVVLSAGETISLDGYDKSDLIILKLSQIVSSVLIFIAPAIAFVYLLTPEKLRYFQLHSVPKLSSVVFSVLLMLASLPLINWMIELNSTMAFPDFLKGVEEWMRSAEANAEKLTEIFLHMDSTMDLLLNLFMIALVAAVSEELFFRGIVQKAIYEASNNAHLSIWIAAILFSAIHGQFYGFIPRAILGVLFGYLFVWSGSLWLPMICHFINNAAAVIFSYLIEKDLIDFDADNVGTLEGETILLLTSLAIVSGLIFLIYRREKIFIRQ
ncbi:MAG: CPBP family intramembrane metalloprotease domain-containing protein [Bacteroidetes bacterium]|nr:MAG: CPBP family intramembrane metalloprotease domain-containing protein [Bacteroidota bacterium]